MRALVLAATALLAACSGPQLLSDLAPETGYQLADNVAYDDANRLRLDVFMPENVRGAPVVVFFYGGRWSRGSREAYKFVGEALASRGMVAVVPDVRLYPAALFPEIMQDAARAVRWTRDTIARYGGDPAKLFVMGHSSGAQIAALLALDPARMAAAGGKREWLRGMIGLAGPYDFLPIVDDDLRDLFGPPEHYDASQPIRFVDGDNPPLLLMHGENDRTIGVENTRKLAQAVARAGGTVETVLYPNLSHSWMVATLGAPLRARADVLDQIADFVRRRAVPPAPVPGVKSRKLQ